MPEQPDTSARFDDRAELYAKYRPGYPAEMYAFLAQETGLGSAAAVADLGSGTGILSAPLLEQGCTVFGVEPSAAMRAKAEADHAAHPRFNSIAGTAEHTGLGASTIDLAIAGQAFHWFDPCATQIELERILKPGGRCALIWNQRLLDATPFLCAYEDFLKTWGTDYLSVSQTYADSQNIETVLGANHLTRSFENSQAFDEEGLLGRLFSSSYIPSADHASAQEIRRALAELFERFEQGGQVQILYTTELFLGRPKS